MSESENTAYTTEQILDIVLTVIRNTRDFERSLGDWQSLPEINKTWTRFKMHFQALQKQLKAIRGPTMQQAGYHHADHLVSQLCADIEKRNQELLTVIQSAMETASTAPLVVSSDISIATLVVTPPQINAVQSNPVQLKMLKILQQMQQSMFSAANQNQGQGRNTYRSRTPRKTPDNASFARANMPKYCWTHGGCSHTSQECNTRAEGHFRDKTFNNRQGGSNAFCPP